jgi:hypothetical protein
MRTIALKVLSAFVVGGEVQTPGAIVEVSEEEAKDLLRRRGKVELATADDAPKAPEAPPPDKGDEAPPAEEDPSLDKLNRAALAAKAQELGLEVADGDTKAQLKAKILEASTKG